MKNDRKRGTAGPLAIWKRIMERISSSWAATNQCQVLKRRNWFKAAIIRSLGCNWGLIPWLNWGWLSQQFDNYLMKKSSQRIEPARKQVDVKGRDSERRAIGNCACWRNLASLSSNRWWPSLWCISLKLKQQDSVCECFGEELFFSVILTHFHAQLHPNCSPRSATSRFFFQIITTG
mgnify:CR=1 FL=1